MWFSVVDYATFTDAKRAIGDLNGTTFRGSNLAVREVRRPTNIIDQ